jgi:RNA polymerase-interacting CarD/CdnL/TRCF family regulator
MATPEDILKEAISLRPLDQAKLVDQLIAVLDTPDPELDKLWADEAESRLDAFKRGKLKSIALEDVLSKYK